MAASGFNSILLYGSTTASATPSAANLTTGASGVELAINATDGKLFYKDNLGVVQVLATKGTGPIGGSNTQVQYNSSGSLAGSANLTFDGMTLTAAGLSGPHNGTVGATTPNTGAFTTLTTSSTVTINGGTANGVAYLNGSKVLTTGSALTFDGTNLGVGVTPAGSFRLEVGGSDGTNIALRSTGTTAAKFRAYVNGAESGVIGFLNGGGQFFEVAGSEQMRLTSTGLGIGTSSPGYKLDVAGASGVAVNIANTSDSSRGGRIVVAGSAASGTVALNTTSSGYALTFGIDSTEKMRLDTSGNLGIGTSSPGAKLQVNSTGVGVAKLVDTSATGYSGLTFAGTGTQNYAIGMGGPSEATFGVANKWFLYDGLAGAMRMVVDSSGNLLVGTTSGIENGIGIFAGAKTFTSGIPQYQLQAQDTTAMAAGVGGAINFTGKYTTAGAFTSFASIEASKDNATSGNFGASMVFKTRTNGSSQDERMRIDSSGNVGIGSNAPTYKLVVSNAGAAGVEINPTGGISGGAFLQCYNRSTAARIPFNTIASEMYWQIDNYEKMRLDSSGTLLVGTTSASFNSSNSTFFYPTTGYWVVNHANGTSTGTRYIGFGYNTGEIGSITQSGTTAVLYNTTSDQRLKENITDADSASDLIDAIKVRQFDWKVDGTHQRYGMIAQELHEVAPEAVHAPKDPDDMMAVDYSKLVPMLIKEIQSLRQRVAQLEVK